MQNKNNEFNEFIGWFIAVLFPFSAFGIMELTKMPILSAAIYYLVFGIFLRYKMEGKLPYFKPQIKKVKVEAIIFLIVAIFASYIYIKDVEPVHIKTSDMIINLFVFALINGSFEHLVWVNIYELAGKRKKYLGVIATVVYVGLIHALYWSKFIPAPEGGGTAPIFMITQFLILLVPLRIYAKTKDLTLWSIQHIIYNILAVVIGGFGISMYLFK